jgi:hypothetical protein
VAREVHSASLVNGVSILSALKAQSAQPMITAPGPARSQPVHDSTFQGQLDAAIEVRNSKDTQQGNTGEGVRRPTAKKKDNAPQQPVIVDAAPAQPPSPPVAKFGLPTAGVKPGPDSGDTSKAKPESNSVTEAADAALAAPGSIPESPTKPAATQVEAVHTESRTELAFALRLSGQPSNSAPATDRASQIKPLATPAEAVQADSKMKLAFAPRVAGQPSNSAPAPTPASPIKPAARPAEAVHPESQTEPAFAPRGAGQSTNSAPAPMPAEAVQAESRMELAFAPGLAGQPWNRAPAPMPAPLQPEIHVAPGESAKPAAAAQPEGTAPPAQPTTLPSPAIRVVGMHAEKPGGSASEFGSNSGKGNSPDKETAQGTPKPVQPQLSESKLQRTSSAPPEPVVQAVKGSPLEASTVTTPAAAPAPATSSAQQNSSSAGAASPVARISEAPAAAVPLTSKSQVTDVSVSVPIPRPDASTDDRVAIRMVQNGAEIHVSVRTPDTQLAQSMRQDLGKLSTGLDQAGFHTEAWRPAAANTAAQSNDSSHRGSSQGSPNRDGNGQNARSGGQGNSGEQRRRQQDERPRWVAELEQQTNP